MLKKTICILASLLMIFSFGINVFAEETDEMGEHEGKTVFHSPANLYYQASSHKVVYNPRLFVLIPKENSEKWAPDTTDWNGRANANYFVVYCSDNGTNSSTEGADYGIYTLDNSRFRNDEQRRKMAAIIGNSYPFLTADEMRENLAAAVSSKEIAEDVTDCTESEWIAATQWAIWDTTALVWQFDVSNVDGAEFPDGHPEKYINPLKDAGHREKEHYQSHIKAIRDWLCSKTVPEKPEVKSYEYEITENEDGTKNIEVKVLLNREAVSGEEINYSISVGERSSEEKTVLEGEDCFEAVMENITESEISDAKITVKINGEHMQAYFYDSENYQDMIGGNWEEYHYDLSFRIGNEKISVSVLKNWADGNPGNIEKVKVTLLANGRPVGDAVIGEENGWSFLWSGLNRFDAAGKEIIYSVSEETPAGYVFSFEKLTDTEKNTAVFWNKKETFDGDGEYLFLSETGALTASYFGEEYYMNASKADVSSKVSETNEKSVWKVTEAEGGYLIESKAFPGQYMNFYYGYGKIGESQSSELQFENGLLFKDFGSYKRYFQGFYSDGHQYLANSEDDATELELYKAEEKELPAADIGFIITNTKAPEVPEKPKPAEPDKTITVVIGRDEEENPSTGAPVFGFAAPVIFAVLSAAEIKKYK